MFNNFFAKTVLSVAITSILIGCGGGGGNSASNGPNVTTPPVGGKEPAPVQGYVYKEEIFNVAEPNTSANKVKVGVIDTGVRKNDILEHAIQKVYQYIEDYEAGTITATDLTNAGIDIQDLSVNNHGTLVASVIAAKKNGDPKYAYIPEGAAKDIAEIYGARTSEQNDGLGYTSGALLAMQDLHDNHGVKLFNGSFGTRSAETEYKKTLTKYAMNLVDGGSLIVFSTGNEGSSTPNIETLLPTFADGEGIEKGLLAATGMDSTKKALYRTGDGKGANACGAAARWCVAADYAVPVYSENLNGNAVFVGTSASAPQITALAANIWSKYPWMTADQVRQTILTTADYVDDGSGQNLFNETFGWGYFNQATALKGPEMFSRIFGEQFVADVDSGLAIFSNNISGDAGLVKGGVGTLVLSGQNTFAGNTIVNNGELRVNGSIESLLTAVSSTGLLTGTGKVGSVENGGTVSTEKGRLTIDGDYNQYEQAKLVYGLEHYLTVTGAANLDGALEVTAQNEKMVTAGKHDVIKAGSITGDFSTVTAKSAFLRLGETTKGDNAYSVDVQFKDAKVAGTLNGGLSNASGELVNQLMVKANAQAVNGESTELTDYVAKIQQVATAEQAQAILNTNAGALFAETPSVLLHNDAMTNAQVAQRAFQVSKQGVTGAWVNGAYQETSTKAKGWDKVDSEISTLTAGADFQVADEVVVGAYVSTYKDDSKFSESNGTSETDLTTFGVYGKWNTASDLYFAANAQYGLGDVEFKRNVTNGVDSEESNAKSDLDKYGVYGEVGYSFITNQWSLSPYAGLSFNSVTLDKVKESSEMGVTVDDVTAKETKLHAGVRFDYRVTENLALGGYGEYANAVDRSLPKVRLASNVDNTVGVNYQAPAYDKEYFLYGVSFNYLTNNSNWNVFGDVVSNVNNSEDIQSQLGLKYIF